MIGEILNFFVKNFESFRHDSFNRKSAGGFDFKNEGFFVPGYLNGWQILWTSVHTVHAKGAFDHILSFHPFIRVDENPFGA